jgi:hypothetical protein
MLLSVMLCLTHKIPDTLAATTQNSMVHLDNGLPAWKQAVPVPKS